MKSRRKFLKRSFWGAMGLGLASGIYAWQVEPYWLEYVRLKMPIKNLPEHLDGKTLMQISDMHVGDRFDYQYIIDSFKEAQELNPDFVVYTGDFVSYEDENQIAQLEQVMKHAVKGKLGTCGILGNHDYGHGWAMQEVADEVCRVNEASGITMLNNVHKEFEGLNIIGFDDYWAINFKGEELMQSYDSEKANLVLCHNPDVCDLPLWNNYEGWILAGHTHGGQVKPPFLPAPMLPVKNKKYDAGEIDLEDGRTLYINRALGNLWPVRFNVRPEITIFTLEKSS